MRQTYGEKKRGRWVMKRKEGRKKNKKKGVRGTNSDNRRERHREKDAKE